MRRLQDFSHHFNPRSRKGSDEVDLPVELGGGISIHAPARGATAQCHPQHKRRKFQSTLPQGERLREGVPVTREGRDFNPRSRKGSDQEYV